MPRFFGISIPHHHAQGGGSGDWALRSGAAGVMTANQLNSPSDITPNVLVNGNEGHASFDSSLAPYGGAGSLKFSVLNSDVADSGSLLVQFTAQGNGSTIWASYRRRAPAEHEFQMWPTSDGPSGRGSKWSILSHSASSNQPYECVVQGTDMRGNVTGYHQDGSGYPGVDTFLATACSGADFSQEPSIDYTLTATLTGTDPDTGSAWSACQQDRHRYAGLYSAKSGAADFAWGLGDPLDGAFRMYPNEWITITQRVIVGTFGSADSRWTVWAAREGQPYILLWDLQSMTLGSGGNGAFNTLWLLPYSTNRVAGGRKISSTLTPFSGCTLLPPGPSVPTGNGTLTYDATTHLFTWAGSGQSAGTGRSYSEANGKLRLNLFPSGSSANTFDQLAIEVNPSALPGSNQSVSVTIADGRNDTQVNYAEAIVSSKTIKATAYDSSGTRIGPIGGYSPQDSGGDTSDLGNAIRALTDGSWGTFTCGTFNPDPSGTTDSQFSYTQRGTYFDGKIYFFGGSHGTGTADRVFLNVYDLDTNSWIYQVHWINDYNLYGHGYYCGTVDRTNGDYIGHNAFGDHTIKRWQLATQTFGSDISPSANLNPTSGPFFAHEWHPNLSGGSLVVANEWAIAYRPNSTGTWTELDNTGPAAQDITATAYNRKDDCVYIGGSGDVVGHPDNRNSLQKITAAGSLVQCADAPNGFGIWDANATSTSMLLPSGNSANKLLQISRDKSINEYDEVGDSWSSVGTIPSGLISGAGVAVDGADCFFTAVDDDTRNIHGIVVFKLANSVTVSSTAMIWKR